MIAGNSALHYACAYGWYFCVKLLLEPGAEPDPPNDWKVRSQTRERQGEAKDRKKDEKKEGER